MDMPGGGVFNVKAGQITDDSELAFHLLKALASFHPENRFDSKIDNLLITIANEYLAWFESRPFDIGITCRKGLAEIAMLYK
jgi:ADP-ribosyl-[dinitrogen reductase] hydrolase